MLELLDTRGSLLDMRSRIDSVYLDMSRAFDEVRRDLFMHRLHEAAFGGNLLRWFSSHLIGRRKRVTVLGAFSRDLPVISRVPQGSLLGPALFLIYMKSLPSAVRNSEVMMFEDDTNTYKEIESRDDCASL